MTKPRKIAVALSVIVVAGVILAWRHHFAEPRYKDVSISEWMARAMVANGNEEMGNPTEAFRAFGTQGVTYLITLTECRDDDPRLSGIEAQAKRLAIGDEWNWLKESLQTLLLSARPSRVFVPDRIRARALTLLYHVQPRLDVVLPLVESRLRSADVDARRNAWRTLFVAEDVMEKGDAYILRGLQDGDTEIRMGTASAVYRRGKASKAIVTAMMAALEKASKDEEWMLVMALGQLGDQASEALPLLRSRLDKEKDGQRRRCFADAIWRIDPTKLDGRKR